MSKDSLITLLGEDGEPHNFEVLGVITVDKNDYAILLPEEEKDFACVFRVEKDEDGEDVLVEIEDDKELDKVAEVWKEINKKKLN